jgi:hypothetical protein
LGEIFEDLSLLDEDHIQEGEGVEGDLSFYFNIKI